jgi:hypothetical protein
VPENWDEEQLVGNSSLELVWAGLNFDYDMNCKWNQQQILRMTVPRELRGFQFQAFPEV